MIEKLLIKYFDCKVAYIICEALDVLIYSWLMYGLVMELLK